MKLPSTLTLPSASQTTEALAQAISALPAGTTFGVDASGLAELDTSALAVLLLSLGLGLLAAAGGYGLRLRRQR